MNLLSRTVAWLSDHEAAVIVTAGVIVAGVRSLLKRCAENSAEKSCEFVCQKRGREKSMEHLAESVPSIGHRFREDLYPGAAGTVRRI